jgi:hypothetical protein
VALAACGDVPRPTAPPAAAVAPRAALSLTPACVREDASFLQQQIGTLFSDARLRQTARARRDSVAARCTFAAAQPYPAANAAQTLASATALALNYTEWLLAQRAAGRVVASDAFLWSYVGRLFGYVGYTVPASANVFDRTGFAQVCRAGAVCQVEAPDGRKAIRFPAGALSGTQPGVPFLVTGIAATCEPFSQFSTYSIFGGCFDISVDPKAGASFALAAPGTIVELCTTAPGTPSYVTARRPDVYSGQITTQGKLGQRSGVTGGGFTPISFRPYAPSILSKNPLDAKDGDYWCDNEKPAPAAATSAFARAGDALLALFRPRVAYAGHGGLGTLPGFAEALSVFGPLDGYAFNGDFEGDAVGGFPGRLAEMRGGSWTLSTFEDPSVASVRVGGPFGSQYLLLNQAGGASAGKEPLTFTGAPKAPLATAPGDPNRVVRLRFRAAVLSSRAFDTRFVVRSSTDALATLRFADGSSAKAGTLTVLAPAGAELARPTTSAAWGQNGVQSFEVTVSFARGTGRARVMVGFVGQPPLAEYTVNAADLASFGWVLAGRDGQLIGSDDYQLFDVAGEDQAIAAN